MVTPKTEPEISTEKRFNFLIGFASDKNGSIPITTTDVLWYSGNAKNPFLVNPQNKISTRPGRGSNPRPCIYKYRIYELGSLARSANRAVLCLL